LAILIKVLSEAERKNWNCLSPAQPNEFSNFSGASLELSKMDKPANTGFRNRYLFRLIRQTLTLQQAAEN